jgi:hypothetical protein
MQAIKTSHMDNRAASWKLFNSFNSKIYPEEKISEKQRHCSSHEPFWILPTIQRVDTAQRASYGSPHSLKSTTYATMHCKLSNAANWIPACNESQVLGIFRNTDIYSVCRSCSGNCMRGRVGNPKALRWAKQSLGPKYSPPNFELSLMPDFPAFEVKKFLLLTANMIGPTF